MFQIQVWTSNSGTKPEGCLVFAQRSMTSRHVASSRADAWAPAEGWWTRVNL